VAGDNAEPSIDDPRDDVSEDEAAAWDDRAAGPSSMASGASPVDDPDDYDEGLERSSEIDDITESMVRPQTTASAETETETTTERADTGAGAGSGADPRNLEAEIEADLHQIIAERDQFKSMAQRIQADFDNYRKRATAQSLAEADRATGRLAEALLPVLDAAEAAYVNHPDEVGPLLNQMLTELKRHGLEVLDLDGKPFDPEFAEAVAHETGEGGEPMVVDVLRSGYSWKGKTLRPAMVRTKD
jgi:molecular chaperone GrpE